MSLREINIKDISKYLPRPDRLKSGKPGRPKLPNRASDLASQSKELERFIKRYHGGTATKFHDWFGFEHSVGTINDWRSGRTIIPEHVAEQLHELTGGRLDKAKLRPSIFDNGEKI